MLRGGAGGGPTRYPDAFAAGAPYSYFTAEHAQRALEAARRVLRWAEEVGGA